jgi:hypothetical protein
MKVMKRWSALLSLLLSACAAPAEMQPSDSATLFAPNRSLALPRLADLGRNVQAMQLITVQRDSDTYVFEGQISITPERFLLVGTDPMGRRAMTVTWTDGGMTTETAPWMPSALRPDSMLADIVMLYWPEDVVRRAIAPAGADLVADARSRTVRIDGRDVLHVDYDATGTGPWTGTLHYANRGWGYEITVQSVEARQ